MLAERFRQRAQALFDLHYLRENGGTKI